MRHLIVVFSFFILSIFSACSPEGAVLLTAGEFDDIMQSSISSDTLPVDQIEFLDPYDCYFLALKASGLGYFEEALVLARHCWKNEGGFIGERAAELSIRLLMENRDYKEAEFLASLASAEYPSNYNVRRAVVEAEYWQRQDRAVLKTLDEVEKYRDSESDGELKLFRAVSVFRLGEAGWQDEWRKLFYQVPASDYIRRGWDYLTAASDFDFDDFSSDAQLFKAKYAHAVGEYTDAASSYRAFLGETGAGSVPDLIVSDIENLYIRSGSKLEGARMLEASGSDSAEFLSAAARLYRRAGRNTDADRCMNRVIEMHSGRLTDRELWYSLDIKIRLNLTNAVDSLEFYIQRWDDADFFADTLNNLCTALAARQRWSSITRLALMLQDTGPSAVYDRCRYISRRAAALGWIAETEFSDGYTELYYRILAGESIDEIKPLTDIQQLSAVCTDAPVPRNEAERYVGGLLHYDTGNVLAVVHEYSEELSEDFLAYTASQSAARGEYLDSIRMMYQFSGHYSITGFRSLYPDIYRTEIEKVSAANDIPPQLMFALVWKESGFENDIVSRSGAVGLSQLMPATAEDVAGRQRMEVEDLTDPVENLELGAWYLNWLKSYVGNTSAAVLSYNGGPGRVGGWLQSWRNLPGDLLYEVVPVAETHMYGKRVLEAAVMYGLLYYGIDAEQTLKIFFQEKL